MAMPAPTGVKSNIEKGCADELLADAGDEDVGRGADQRRQPADERAEGQRHEEFRRRAALALGELEGDRQEDRQRADILHEGGEHGDQGDQHADLQVGRFEIGRDAPHEAVDEAGIADRGADDERAGDQRHDLVAEAGEGLVGRNDAREHGGEQRQQGDDVVAQPVPQEQHQHGGKDGEDENLRGCHGWVMVSATVCERAVPAPCSGPPAEVTQTVNGDVPPTIAGLTRSRATWLGYLAMCVGMFMAMLDIQIVASSLPEIQAGLAIPLDALGWVQTAYLIAEIIAIPLTGWLTQLLSLRGLFLAAIVGFTLASAGCAASTGFAALIAFRVVQGFCGGALIPAVFTAVFALFPERLHVRATTIAGAVAMLAPTLGPTLGGYITETYSWPWLFLVNIVPGIVTGTAAAVFLRTAPGDRERAAPSRPRRADPSRHRPGDARARAEIRAGARLGRSRRARPPGGLRRQRRRRHKALPQTRAAARRSAPVARRRLRLRLLLQLRARRRALRRDLSACRASSSMCAAIPPWRSARS